jgi:hypothetical protein
VARDKDRLQCGPAVSRRRSGPVRGQPPPADLYIADPPFARVKEAWHDAHAYETDAGRLAVTVWVLVYGWILDLRDLVRRR